MGDADEWIEKGRKLGGLGRDEEALECFNKSLEIEPENAYALSYKGWALHFLERNEEALEYLNKSLEIEPENEYTLDLKKYIEKNLVKEEPNNVDEKKEHWAELQHSEEAKYREAILNLFSRLGSDDRDKARKYKSDYKDLVGDTEDEWLF